MQFKFLRLYWEDLKPYDACCILFCGCEYNRLCYCAAGFHGFHRDLRVLCFLFEWNVVCGIDEVTRSTHKRKATMNNSTPSKTQTNIFPWMGLPTIVIYTVHEKTLRNLILNPFPYKKMNITVDLMAKSREWVSVISYEKKNIVVKVNSCRLRRKCTALPIGRR